MSATVRRRLYIDDDDGSQLVCEPCAEGHEHAFELYAGERNAGKLVWLSRADAEALCEFLRSELGRAP